MSIRILWEFSRRPPARWPLPCCFMCRKNIILLRLIGGCGWVCYEILLNVCSAPVATFFANTVVVLLSRFFAVRKQCPVTLFLVSGIFPLVPGSGDLLDGLLYGDK